MSRVKHPTWPGTRDPILIGQQAGTVDSTREGPVVMVELHHVFVAFGDADGPEEVPVEQLYRPVGPADAIFSPEMIERAQADLHQPGPPAMSAAAVAVGVTVALLLVTIVGGLLFFATVTP